MGSQGKEAPAEHVLFLQTQVVADVANRGRLGQAGRHWHNFGYWDVDDGHK